jgi:hypothetical protein
VDDATRVAIMDRLKRHPQDKLQAFLSTFAIAKIRELKVKDAPRAIAMLDEWEGKTAAPPPAPVVDDPFA